MLRIAAEPAFVLHARAWRETSLLVEVLSEQHGRVGLVARGVRAPKAHQLRAALQPLQHVRFDAVQSGELAQLRSAEALDAAPQLSGDAALGGFYACELLLRLAPRSDPHPGLYRTFGRCRARLGLDEPVAWTLRRFERDVLDELGSGFALDVDGDGEAIDPAARYVLDPEQGPRRMRDARGRVEAATGSGLLALAEDREPEGEDLASLRRALRPVFLHHLGGRGLKSWELVGELGRLLPRKHPQRDGS
jgi:DNA repair protein RecO (recombination protein O)